MLRFMFTKHGVRPDGLLIGACLAVAVTTLAALPLSLAPGWDELVYLSRYAPYDPATPFSAPRSRGVPLLVAPVAAVTDSVVVLRCYLTATATLALYLGFRPWTRVLGSALVPAVAAAGYGSLWIALFYAGAAMPNHYLAMAAVGAVGCFLLAVAPRATSASVPSPASARPARGPLVGLALALCVAALMRPSDAVWLAAPLLLAPLAVPAWRKLAPAAAVAAGLAAGLVPWAVEAHTRFGGIRQRLREASDIQGGMRPTFSLPEYVTTLDGPLLCRPCTGDAVDWPAVGWWVALPPLVALGLYAAHRAGRAAAAWLAVLVATATAATYLAFLPYAAPRFLLPAYALLAIPAALGGIAAVRRAWPSTGTDGTDGTSGTDDTDGAGRAGVVGARLAARATARRRVRATVVIVALVGVCVAHGTVHWDMVRRHVRVQERARADWQHIAAVLREQGVRPPCLVGGTHAVVPIAHAAGCRSQRDTPDGRESGGGVPDAFVLRGDRRPPPWARAWPRHRVPDAHYRGWRVAVAPRPGDGD
ncbi:hypothetical protein GCM10023324_22870 [Streptomyces youssoufiensis]